MLRADAGELLVSGMPPARRARAHVGRGGERPMSRTLRRRGAIVATLAVLAGVALVAAAPQARLRPHHSREALDRRAAEGLEPDRHRSGLGDPGQDPEAGRGQRQHQAGRDGPLAAARDGSRRSLQPVLPAVPSESAAPGAEPRLGIRDQRGRVRRLEQPRRRRRQRDPRQARRTAASFPRRCSDAIPRPISRC